MRVVPRCLIVILSWTLIASSATFGEGPGEQTGDQEGNSPTTQPAAAPATDGLRISVEVTDTQHPDAVVFRVSIENVGDEDTLLNLGEMLGNGRALLPDAIRLTLTDSAGASRELHFSDRRFPGVAGRVDDYIVSLRAGSVHTLRLNLNDFWCPDTQEFQIELKPDAWNVRAEFTGTGAVHLNTGTEGVRTFRFWTGRLESATAQFKIGADDAETAAARRRWHPCRQLSTLIP